MDPSEILSVRFLDPSKNLSKFCQTLRDVTKFWLDLAKFLAWSRVGPSKFSDLAGPVEFFDLGFHPQGQKILRFWQKFLSKSVQKIPRSSEFFVLLLEIFPEEISKRRLKIWNLFQILRRNSVRIPLISQIPLVENFRN